MKKRVFALLWLGVLLGGCGAQPPLAPELSQLLDRINEVRKSGYECQGAGWLPPVAPLRENALLNRVAQWHAEDMDATGEFSHTTPAGAVHFAAGATPGARIANVGYLASAVAENIAKMQTPPEAVLQAWLDSRDGHCEALLKADLEDAGLGRNGAYWVLDMAAPQ